MKYNPLVKYGFDEVGSATGGTTSPTPSVDVIAKIKEEIARSSATMTYSFNHSYKNKLEIVFFSCRKVFGICHCDIYISVKEGFTCPSETSLIFFSDPTIATYHNHVMPVGIFRWNEYFYFIAKGTDSAYIDFKDDIPFEFKPYDIINISKTFSYVPK